MQRPSTDRRSQAAPDAIPSPYNFVPLSEHVVLPTWGNIASHDVPFEQGISGWIDLELEALTPIFCRGESGRFFETAHGKHAIPGTTLRGTLRNVIEIATFGRMDRVDNGWYGLRDLQNRHTYGQYMAEIRDGNPTPLVNAGWLICEGSGEEERWFIRPCHLAKMEYGTLQGFAEQAGIPNYNPGRKQSAVDKYFAWVGLKSPRTPKEIEGLELEAWRRIATRYELPVRTYTAEGTRHKDGSTRISRYGKVARGQPAQGRLVFTGQPSEFPAKFKGRGSGNPKHHDFFFYGDAGAPIDVTHLRDRFEGAHRDAGQQGRNEIEPNVEWRFWRSGLKYKVPVPVFFLTEAHRDRPTVRAFGLAMMFRLAYDHSTRDLVANVQKGAWADSADGDIPDFADLLFGYVRDNSRQSKRANALAAGALRGRVSIGQAVAMGRANLAPPIQAVLGVPKPTFYPNYVCQGGRDGARPPDPNQRRAFQWSTYMKESKGDIPRPRGWKRYIARDTYESKPPRPPDIKSDKVFTTLRPLDTGTHFRGRVRVHNLLPVELGALLWAIELGQVEGARHLIGQGRPFGLGQTRMRIATKTGLRQIQDGAEPDLDACRRAFSSYMEQNVPGGWARSAQMRELLALAIPVGDPVVERTRFRYPQLKNEQRRNEFVEAKKEGAVLPLHGGSGRPSPLEPNLSGQEPWMRLGAGDTLHSKVELRPEETAAPPVPKGEAPRIQRSELPRDPSVGSKTEQTGGPILPTKSSGPGAIPDTFEVQFLRFDDAQARRGIYVKQRKKQKIKPFTLTVVPTDPQLAKHPSLGELVVSTTETDGIGPLFDWLAQVGYRTSFTVRRPPEGQTVIPCVLKADKT